MQRKRSALGIRLQVYVDVVPCWQVCASEIFLQVSRCTVTQCSGGKVLKDKNFEKMWRKVFKVCMHVHEIIAEYVSLILGMV